MLKIAWGFGILTIIFTLVGCWLLVSASTSSFWPTVNGTITETRVAAQVNMAYDALRRYLTYKIEVEYVYSVDQQHYSADRYSLGEGSTVKGQFKDQAAAKAWLKQSPFQTGEQVVVYVDPNDPENTVLNAGIQVSTWVPLLLALCLGGMTWLCFWLSKKIPSAENSN